MFSDTIRFNLDPFFEHSDEELWRVLEISSLKKYVKSLPGGLNSMISENGDNLRYILHSSACSISQIMIDTDFW